MQLVPLLLVRHFDWESEYPLIKIPGFILDLEYRRTAAKHGHSIEKSKDHDLASFPIEEARLGSLKYVLTICCFLIIGYGWAVQYRVVSKPV